MSIYDGLRTLRSEYIRDFIKKEGGFYNQSRGTFLNAVRRYITWSFLSETVMGKNPHFDDDAHKLGLEKKVFEFYAKRNGNGHNGNGNGHRILKMLQEKKNKAI